MLINGEHTQRQGNNPVAAPQVCSQVCQITCIRSLRPRSFIPPEVLGAITPALHGRCGCLPRVDCVKHVQPAVNSRPGIRFYSYFLALPQYLQGDRLWLKNHLGDVHAVLLPLFIAAIRAVVVLFMFANLQCRERMLTVLEDSSSNCSSCNSSSGDGAVVQQASHRSSTDWCRAHPDFR